MMYSEKLADTLMSRYPDPDGYPYRSWCYAQGFMLWGFIHLYEYTGERRYLDYVIAYGQKHVAPNESIPAFKGDSLDDIMAGSVLAWLYHQTKDPKYRTACKTIRAAFNDYPRTPADALWHARSLPQEFWVDGVFMGGMFLLHYAAYIQGNNDCLDEASHQIRLIYEACKKDGTGLIYHAHSYDKSAPWADPVSGCSPEVWSEGLGWYALILSEAAMHLDAAHPTREGILRQYHALLESLKRFQDAQTGLWYQVVDKGHQADNWQDTSGSAMFGYAILRAVRLGIVSKEEWMPCVDRAYEGLKQKYTFTSTGLMDIHDACKGLCVQTGYEKYVFYPRVVNANEAVAAVLWFVTEYEKGDAKPCF